MKPLYLSDPKRACPHCGGSKRARVKCEACHGTGYAEFPLTGWWSGVQAGFLVGGGPSLSRLPYQRLNERGVVSLGVNNVAAFAPVRAWTFHDPQVKFHHSLFFDPAMLTFAPSPKLSKCVRVRLPSGEWRMTSVKVGECPATVGYSRRTIFDPDTFFDDWFAHVGFGGKQQANQPFRRIATIFCGLRLLVNLGVRRVYLLGVDLRRDSKRPGEAYCFNERGSSSGRMLEKENAMFHMLKPSFEREGIEVFNCSPDSRCDAFPYVEFDKAIEDCKGPVPDEPYDLSGWYSKGEVKAMREANQPLLSLEETVKLMRQQH